MLIADSNFLIPNSTLIVELVAFLVVLFFISKVVLPPLKKALDDRAGLIRSELAAADEAKADATAADEERRSALEEARQQAREIVAQANRTAEQALWAMGSLKLRWPVNALWRKRQAAWVRSSWTWLSASSAVK